MELRLPSTPEHRSLLPAPALELLAALERDLGSERRTLLAARRTRQAAWDA